MAINKSFAKFLLYQRKEGIDFSTMITLGRMKLYASKEDLKNLISKYGSTEKLEDLIFSDEYAEPFYKLLGTFKCDSMDYSDYEKANILHDLNKPVSSLLISKYNVVLDSGTLEHVFNFPVAIKNCMEMVKVGGHFIGVTPANNLFGHGFYQFSPELYYRIFSKENGFEITKMSIGILNINGDVEKWYDVKDPLEVHSRVMLINNKETFLFIVAKRLKLAEIFATTPYQSDYSTTWKNSKEDEKRLTDASFKSVYRRYAPLFIKKIIKKYRNKLNKTKFIDEHIGSINPAYFKEINF